MGFEKASLNAPIEYYNARAHISKRVHYKCLLPVSLAVYSFLERIRNFSVPGTHNCSLTITTTLLLMFPPQFKTFCTKKIFLLSVVSTARQNKKPFKTKFKNQSTL